VADRVSADPEAAFRSQLFNGIQPERPFSIENVRIASIRRSKIDKLIELIIAAGQIEDWPNHQTGADGSYSQTIGGRGTVDNVCSLSACGAWYKLEQ
jgi:hypothetical protein